MFYILKQDGIDHRIVGKFKDGVFEYDDEELGVIYNNIKNLLCYKKVGNKKIRCDSMMTKFENRLYYPYSISTKENPEFEIYRYELK